MPALTYRLAIIEVPAWATPKYLYLHKKNGGNSLLKLSFEAAAAKALATLQHG